MKSLLIGLMLLFGTLSAFAIQEPPKFVPKSTPEPAITQGKPIEQKIIEFSCAENKEMIDLTTKEGMVPIFMAVADETRGYVVVVNPDSKLWAVIMVIKEENRTIACILGIGKSEYLQPQKSSIRSNGIVY